MHAASTLVAEAHPSLRPLREWSLPCPHAFPVYTKGKSEDISVLAGFVTVLLGILVFLQSLYFAIGCSSSSTIIILLIDNSSSWYQQHPTAYLDKHLSRLSSLQSVACLPRSHCDTRSFACILSVLGWLFLVTLHDSSQPSIAHFDQQQDRNRRPLRLARHYRQQSITQSTNIEPDFDI